MAVVHQVEDERRLWDCGKGGIALTEFGFTSVSCVFVLRGKMQTLCSINHVQARFASNQLCSKWGGVEVIVNGFLERLQNGAVNDMGISLDFFWPLERCSVYVHGQCRPLSQNRLLKPLEVIHNQYPTLNIHRIERFRRSPLLFRQAGILLAGKYNSPTLLHVTIATS